MLVRVHGLGNTRGSVWFILAAEVNAVTHGFGWLQNQNFIWWSQSKVVSIQICLLLFRVCCHQFTVVLQRSIIYLPLNLLFYRWKVNIFQHWLWDLNQCLMQMIFLWEGDMDVGRKTAINFYFFSCEEHLSGLNIVRSFSFQELELDSKTPKCLQPQSQFSLFKTKTRNVIFITEWNPFLGCVKNSYRKWIPFRGEKLHCFFTFTLESPPTIAIREYSVCFSSLHISLPLLLSYVGDCYREIMIKQEVNSLLNAGSMEELSWEYDKKGNFPFLYHKFLNCK